MKLAFHSDASYLSEPKARRRAGRHFFFIQRSNDTPKQQGNYQHFTHNQTRHDINNRSRTIGTLNHGSQSRIHQNNIGGDVA